MAKAPQPQQPSLSPEQIEKLLQANPALVDALRLPWNDYIKEDPSPKQRAFLTLPHQEAFYGGAAGGGKSSALLMGALQYVDIPGYAGLILRKSLSDLKLPSSLLSRAHEWLGDAVEQGMCKFVPSEHAYYFPTVDNKGKPAEPARVVFGYIGQEGVQQRYRSAEFQYIAFDELTEHFEEDYLFMFSRMRKRVCPTHRLKNGKANYVKGCHFCETQQRLPLRMRTASNPGGRGHAWVKDRFGIRETIAPDGSKRFLGTIHDRPYIPAFVWDNEHIDQEGYMGSLQKLDPVTREQLLRGDWSVSDDSRFKKSWVRYYSRRGNSYVLGRDGKGKVVENFQRVFSTVDPAGSTREGPGDTKRIVNRDPSWSVIMTFGLTYDYHLLILDVRRFRAEIPDILPVLRDVYKTWRPQKFIVEGSGLGRGVFQLAQKHGFPVEPIFPHADKIVRSTDAQVRMEQGRIWLPEPPGDLWVETFENELFTWTGHPHQTDDQIDALAYGAMDVSWEAAAAERGEIFEELGYADPDVPAVVFSGRHFRAVPNLTYDQGSGHWFNG
jgi:predicted phage terminase large subunit-like protein